MKKARIFLIRTWLWALPLLLMPGVGICGNSGDANWTDRKEYDLVLTIRSETTPQRRLELLDQWKKAYPNSRLKAARLELYLQTYLTLAKPAESFRISREILAADPNSGLGSYWCSVILPEVPNVTPDGLDAGEKAAQQLIEHANVYFKMENKPASVDPAQWQKKAVVTEALAHRALGWANWQRGDLAAAEIEFTKSLAKDPDNTQVSAWLGIVLSLETGKQVAALWQLARASNPASANIISEEQRRQVNGILEHVYASYHGSLDGLDDLRKASAARAVPDDAFTIDSANIVAARRAEQELSLTNPELAAWLSIRRQLTAADGQQYFSANLASKPTPWLKGTVVKSIGTRASRELLISMAEGADPELALKLTAPIGTYTGAGTKLTFRGIPESFTSDPFSLVLRVDPGDVQPAAKSVR